MPKRVAILQSNYIPWKGYFDIIHDVDEFIFLDDVRYTKQNWRNRNRIKTSRGPDWLTIPVGDRQSRLICDVKLPATDWPQAHWRRIEASYADAPFFDMYEPTLRPLYLSRSWQYLSDFNRDLIVTIARDLLGITVCFRDSRDLGGVGRGQERLLELLGLSGADMYVSGPAAKNYIDPERFDQAGIAIEWTDYGGYPEYPQLYPPFTHDVTILDLLFHTGPAATNHIWGWRRDGL